MHKTQETIWCQGMKTLHFTNSHKSDQIGGTYCRSIQGYWAGGRLAHASINSPSIRVTNILLIKRRTTRGRTERSTTPRATRASYVHSLHSYITYTALTWSTNSILPHTKITITVESPNAGIFNSSARLWQTRNGTIVTGLPLTSRDRSEKEAFSHGLKANLRELQNLCTHHHP